MWREALASQYAIADNYDPDSHAYDTWRSSVRSAQTFAWNTDCLSEVSRAAQSIPVEASLSSAADSLVADQFWAFPPGSRICGVEVAAVMIGGWATTLTKVFGQLSSEFRDHFVRDHFVVAFASDGSAIGAVSWRGQQPDISLGSIDSNVLLSVVMAGLAWLRQRVVIQAVTQHIERHERKRIMREHGLDVAPTIKLVTLRRADYLSSGESASSGRYLAERHIVDGHWKLQAHGPCFSDRKLIWVDSYIRGPEDAPLREYERTVYVVTR